MCFAYVPGAAYVSLSKKGLVKHFCIKKQLRSNAAVFLMEIMGFEPTAFRMRTERSPTELYPRLSYHTAHLRLMQASFSVKMRGFRPFDTA